MKCLGCYNEVKVSYCLKCRKVLFDNSKIPSVLDFDAPKANNIGIYQENAKQLSISGVQLKYSLQLHEKHLILSEKHGQYILKPIPPAKHLINLEDVPENEHLTMQIAKEVFGINTAPNALILFKDGEPAYITKRFDITPTGTKYLQEDFAQLTNRTKQSHGETYKYDGTYEEIGLLIKKYVAAAVPTIEKFFRLIVFNYIISNGDAHLKNFSLIRTENGEYGLTPAYDLLSTVIHTPLESDTALDFYCGDIYSPHYSTYGHYGRSDFIELAKRLGILEKRALRIIDLFPAREGMIQEMVERSLLSDHIKQTYINNVSEKLGRII